MPITLYGWKLASDPSIGFELSLDSNGNTTVIDATHPDCISVMGQMTGILFEKNWLNVAKYGGQALKIQNIPNRDGSPRPPTDITFQNNLFYSTAYGPGSGYLLLIAGGKT